MRAWSDVAISRFYLDKTRDMLATNCLPCTKMEPVALGCDQTMIPHDATVHENSIVYRGSLRNDSVMMFTLVRATHSRECRLKHTCEPIPACNGILDELEGEDDEIQRAKQKNIISQKRKSVGIENMTRKKPCRSEIDEDVSSIDDEDSVTSGCNTDDSGDGLDMSMMPGDPNQWSDISDLQLFQHQRDIIEAVRNSPARGYVSAICGSGKSLPMTICCKEVRCGDLCPIQDSS